MASLNGVHVPELLSRRTIFVKVLGKYAAFPLNTLRLPVYCSVWRT
jgi:hypothetical protein